jgi:Protein of unknown function (DUF2946).
VNGVITVGHGALMRMLAADGLCGTLPRPQARRAAISALVLSAFVIRLMLAAVPMSSPAAAPGATLIPICTAEGLKWLPFNPGGPVKPAKTGLDCPLCMAAQGLLLLVPLAVLPLPRQTVVVAEHAFHREAPRLRLAARPPPSRAPPLLSASETTL